MISLRMERGWADTAHTTELQPVFCSVVRIGRFGPGLGERMRIYDRNMGPDLFCRPDIPVLNIVVETSSPLRRVGCLL